MGGLWGLLVGVGIVSFSTLAWGQASEANYEVILVENPTYRPNELFLSQEDISSPRFEQVRTLYKLREVLAGEEDELKCILLLRHWVHNRLVVDQKKPAPTGDALVYLAEGPKGGAYHCGHHMVAENAVLNAMGYVARCLNAGPGGKEPPLTGHHGMCEVWVNQLCKWVVVDSEHDAHFEKAGVPLSALEIRDEVIRNGGTDVVRVDGPDRVPQPRERDESWGRTPRTYNFVSWFLQGDIHSGTHPRSSAEVVLDDEYWRTHTWYRDGKKHWAYEAGYFLPVRHRDWIEWTPNVLQVKTTIEGDRAQVQINSATPNFKEYQIKEVGGEWERVEEPLTLELAGEGGEWWLRAVNVAGVCGPEYHLLIKRK